MIGAAIIDFDGPIFDGREAMRKAYSATVAHFAAQDVGPPGMTLHGVPLMGPDRLISYMYSDFLLAPAKLAEIRAFHNEQLVKSERELGISSQVKDSLRALKEGGLRLAVLTGRTRENVESLIADTGLAGMFDVVAGRDTVPNPKPSPDAVGFVMTALGVSRDEVLMIGDADIDYLAASGARIAYCHAAWTGEPSVLGSERAFHTLESLEELIHIMRAPSLPACASVPPAELLQAVTDGHLAFFAGAGVSIPSGFGGWATQYLPLLRKAQVAWMAREALDLPEILQLACATADTESALFDAFRGSFSQQSQPNAYHFAMLRAPVPRIWTSNYDRMFEKAIDDAEIPDTRVVNNDERLLEHYRDSNLVIKVNGDFESAQFETELDWGVVATQQQFDLADTSRREIWRLFEDDFRNRSVVFVGVSFRDAALRRVLALAARRVPRTRHNHYFLACLPSDPIERALLGYVAANLARFKIKTLTFVSFEAIERFIAQLAVRARRPIVGVSGNTNLAETDTQGTGSDDVVLEDGLVDGACLREMSGTLGRALAEQGFRVASGCAPYVGIEAVRSAFEVNGSLARFYLRNGGGSRYGRDAPAVVSKGTTYADMREIFIGAVSVLVGMGGYPTDPADSGVVDEIKRALGRGVPVLLIPQAGGAVGRFRGEFMNRLDSAYKDARLIEAVRTANDAVAAVGRDDLRAYMADHMTAHIEDLLCALVCANSGAEAGRNFRPEW